MQSIGSSYSAVSIHLGRTTSREFVPPTYYALRTASWDIPDHKLRNLQSHRCLAALSIRSKEEDRPEGFRLAVEVKRSIFFCCHIPQGHLSYHLSLNLLHTHTSVKRQHGLVRRQVLNSVIVIPPLRIPPVVPFDAPRAGAALGALELQCRTPGHQKPSIKHVSLLFIILTPRETTLRLHYPHDPPYQAAAAGHLALCPSAPHEGPAVPYCTPHRQWRAAEAACDDRGALARPPG